MWRHMWANWVSHGSDGGVVRVTRCLTLVQCASEDVRVGTSECGEGGADRVSLVSVGVRM